jgi:arginase
MLGVPTSAGAFAPGQERAPRALRAAGLPRLLARSGVEVRDHGDRALYRWRPDRGRPRAQNLEAVVDIVRDTAARVGAAAQTGERTLVLGGDCTIGIGSVAAHVDTGERVALVYFDTHADLNVPGSVPYGALDWMGVAHMLGLDGAELELVAAGPRTPLLEPEQVILFGWGAEQATEFEREVVERLRLEVVPAEEVARDPEAAATRARQLAAGRGERLLVHFDVDVIDFNDMPLSENPGRGEGVTYEAAMRALPVLLAAPQLAGLTITELNPDHAAAVEGSVEEFVLDLTTALARAQ